MKKKVLTTMQTSRSNQASYFQLLCLPCIISLPLAVMHAQIMPSPSKELVTPLNQVRLESVSTYTSDPRVMHIEGYRFRSYANLKHWSPSTRVGFDGAVFDSNVDLSHSRFDSTLHVSNSQFKGDLHLAFAAIDSTAIFDNVAFGPIVDLDQFKINADLVFRNVYLPDTLYLTNIDPGPYQIDLTSAMRPAGRDRCLIDLEGTDVSRLRLNMNVCELWFPNPGMSFDEKESICERLLKKLKDDGLMESAKLLDIDYKKLRYANSNVFVRYIEGILDRIWWNYGYNKECILAWTLGLFLLFSFRNCRYYPALYDIFKIKSIGCLSEKELHGRWWLRLYQSTVYTAVVFFGLKFDLTKIQEDRIWQHPILFLSLIGEYVVGLVCVGFLVNFVLSR